VEEAAEPALLPALVVGAEAGALLAEEAGALLLSVADEEDDSSTAPKVPPTMLLGLEDELVLPAADL
jgi:hypothetical protein